VNRLLAVVGAAERAWDMGAKIAASVVAVLLTAVLAWLRARRRRLARESEERAADRAVLLAVAEYVRLQLDEARWHDSMTSTGRITPITMEELAERRGACRQRRADVMRHLWTALGHEEHRAVKSEQDMFRTNDLTDEERQP
jgi:cell division protein FtsL